MQRILLYYPDAGIPNKEWLYSSILYADKISSLVYLKRGIPESLKFLYENGEYTPIDVSETFRNYSQLTIQEKTKYENVFYDTFLDNIDRYQKVFFRKNSLQYLIDEKVKNWNSFFLSNEYRNYFSLIISSHFSKSLLDKLYGSDLYSQADNYIWKDLATTIFLSIAVQYVANENKNLVIPSTDSKELELLYNNTNKKKHSFNLILNSCLPIPNLDTDIKTIIAFKHKRKDNLLRFRQYVSSIQNMINQADNSEQVKEILIEFKEKIYIGINDIQRTMKDIGINNTYITFENLLNVENPKLFDSLLTVGLISSTIHPIIGASIGSIGVMGRMISSNLLQKRKNINSNELSYLFLAKKEKII